MTDSALSLLGLALRGNNLAVGEVPVEEACKARRAHLMLSAADAAQNSVDRARRWAENGGIPWAPPRAAAAAPSPPSPTGGWPARWPKS